MYDHGDGVPKDKVKAFEWYQKAAKQEFGPAMFNLGIFYDSGRGVKEIDKHLAFTWYLKAAEKGIPAAQYNVSIMYDDGVGVEKNPTMAFKWFTEANKTGYVDMLRVALRERQENNKLLNSLKKIHLNL